MSFTVQQAQAELARRSQQSPQNDISAEEAQEELNRRTQQQNVAPEQDKGLLGAAIQRAGGILPFLKQATAIPAGGLQEIGRLTSAIPGSQFGLGAVAKLAASRPQAQQLLQQSPTLGKVGKGVADIAAFAGTEGLAAPAIEAAGAPALLSKLAASGVGGAAVSPDNRITGAALGTLAGGGLEGIKAIGGLVRQTPSLFIGKLAKNITNTAEAQKQVGNQLYSRAFQGTENLTPTVSQKTGQSIKNLQELFPGRQSSVNKALGAFQRNPSLEGLHSLRSDFSKIFHKIGDKAIKSGLDSTQIDQQAALDETVSNLTRDTQNNLSKISPEKLSQYEEAQNHWRDNVIPFRNLNSVRKLLGTEKEVSPSLFKDIAKESISAGRVRKLTGVSKTAAQTGEFLHRKYFGIPIGLWLAGGIGGGTLFGKHVL